MQLDPILAEAVRLQATDVHLRVGSPAILRVDGDIRAFDETALTAADTRQAVEWVLRNHRVELQAGRELDIGYAVEGLGRFRANIFTEGGQIGLVLRVMPPSPKDIASLHLPNVLSEVACEERGLVLVTGVTGSGKSTTLAAMIDHVNQHLRKHIVTVEDPIEYVHEEKQCLITQRQIGVDTSDFAMALRAALRQDPDVILIGEMRDRETIDSALLAAETGHMVFSTLHTVDAYETISRILATYPPHQQQQVRTQMADVLRAVVSQRLLPHASGSGLVPAVEILINTKFVSECIRDEKRTHRLTDVMADGAAQYGMQTFDQSLLALVENQFITEEVAIAAATSPNDLKLQLRGIVNSMQARKVATGTVGLGPAGSM
ncbi:MAG: PilT/PilU family type 4a pilus ATPase [Acidobacteria bacterium]|nr:PilT/PilU family type 4a pilus ATPase [Acidobacteriota bacterium]